MASGQSFSPTAAGSPDRVGSNDMYNPLSGGGAVLDDNGLLSNNEDNHAVGGGSNASSPTGAGGTSLARPYNISHRVTTEDTQLLIPQQPSGEVVIPPSISRRSGSIPNINTSTSPLHGSPTKKAAAGNDTNNTTPSSTQLQLPPHCVNPASEINSRLDTQVEVRVYPCNNNSNNSTQKKKFTQFHVKPEGVIIQGTNRHRASQVDLGTEYATHIGRKLQRYELSDTRACQLLVTTHGKSFWVVPAPEAFSRHSGTCRLLGDRKHPPASHTLAVGDFLRVGSVGVVVIETHDGVENRILSEEKIQKIMKDTTSSNGGFLDLAETDGENSDDSSQDGDRRSTNSPTDVPTCYMCFDDEDTTENPLITPCKCLGDTRYVHVECLRKWHTAEADNQICFLSSVDATCSVCKTTFRSDFKLKDGRMMKLFKSSLEPPYVSLLVATKHEMAQRLFNTRFQLSFSTLLKPDGRNGTRSLMLGRSSGSDMVLDYRTVSARHASIRFKNGEFLFTDAGSSNGSYLYLRRPVELNSNQSVQFRLGRSMISMKVVNKWNRRLLRAVTRRTGGGNSSSNGGGEEGGDDPSVGSNEDDVRVTDNSGSVTRTLPRRTRENIMESMPALGTLSQNSAQHMDLLYALAYPKKIEKDVPKRVKPVALNTALLPSPPMEQVSETPEENDVEESKADDEVVVDESHGQDDVDEVLDEIAEQVNDMSLEGERETEDVEDTNTNQNLNDQIDICAAETEAAEETDDAQEENVGEQDAAGLDEAGDFLPLPGDVSLYPK
eukprot:CAMPEP_0201688380 /NCGR_PEP_ID=MMETSP0578-20130828/2134_1 /ASSEMBLY_ACC=CAM_ASM_000663 /TAXON_ID=267565 /ORGANISM="Skeletonema grethea, Strain CCMP 1804" /LENGTH=777 /DNA_ID=CAMNT_0048172673 /DNA_START=272 /DNA_END=2605 /DNA_ORIENTATION=-